MEYAIIFLPLIGSIFGYLGRSVNRFFSEILTTLLVSISAILSVIIFWNGIQDNGFIAPSGNYFISINQSNEISTRKITLLK